MRFFRSILFLALLIVPATSFAVDQTTWDFRGQVPGAWEVSGKDAPQATDQGIHINAVNEDVMMVTPLTIAHPIEVVEFVLSTGNANQLTLLWHRRGSAAGNLVQLPFAVSAGAREQTVRVNLDAIQEWDRDADQFGFVVPKGSEILVHEIRFDHWNLFERALEMGKSFWTFDTFTPIAINFLWGPLMTTNPVGTQDLFTTLPPRGDSGMRIFYGALIIVIILLVADGLLARGEEGWTRRFRAGRLSGRVGLFLLCFTAAWIVFDVRMGAEILRYVKTDYASWIAPPSGQKMFRTYLSFNDAVEQAIAQVPEGETLAVLRGPDAPITAMARYFAFPIPIEEPKGPRPDLHVWLVFLRDNVALDSESRMTVDGVPWTAPGDVMQKFNNALIFKTR